MAASIRREAASLPHWRPTRDSKPRDDDEPHPEAVTTGTIQPEAASLPRWRPTRDSKPRDDDEAHPEAVTTGTIQPVAVESKP